MKNIFLKKIISTLVIAFELLFFAVPVIHVQAAGSCGNYDVSTIQIIVNVNTDGICGPITIAAIKQWQSDHGLTPDGIVGPQTAQAMGLISDTGSGNNSGTQTNSTTNTKSGAGVTSGCPDGWQSVGAGTCAPPSPASSGFLGTKTIGELITNILKVLLALSGVIAVALVVWGGFQYMTSAGNAEAAEKGKNTLVNAIIGLVIVMISWLVINLITNTITSGKLF